ncbi:MAG TPA: hypothetical protein GX703_07065 [Erysipelothrix sp.]|nr:hypothetical protein [Erysipelothrix sp.]
MKKIILIGLMLLTILAGCSNNEPEANEINYVESPVLMDKLDNGESFFLVIGNTTCAACIQYKPTLEEVVSNKDAELFYIEVDVENGKSEASRQNVIKFFEEYLNDEINATPSTIYFKDGKLDEYRVGLIKYTDLVAWIESK